MKSKKNPKKTVNPEPTFSHNAENNDLSTNAFQEEVDEDSEEVAAHFVTEDEKLSDAVSPSSSILNSSDDSDDENSETIEPVQSTPEKAKSKTSGKDASFSNDLLQAAIEAALAALSSRQSSKDADNENGNIRMVPDADRLVGRKNFKAWSRMIDLDLQSYDLIECIHSEDGDPEWNAKKRSCMKARAQTYINNAVSSNIRSTILKCRYLCFQSSKSDKERLW
jgi:hypothetical protein